jgi:selenocysteine-specific elongation factor
VEAELRIGSEVFRDLMKHLVAAGRLIEAAPMLYFHREVYDAAVERLRRLFAQRPDGELTVSEMRQELGMTRRYAVPLAELLDRQGVTLRTGDKRRLMDGPSALDGNIVNPLRLPRV